MSLLAWRVNGRQVARPGMRGAFVRNLSAKMEGTEAGYSFPVQLAWLHGKSSAPAKHHTILQPQMGEDERAPRGDREISPINARSLVPLAKATSR